MCSRILTCLSCLLPQSLCWIHLGADVALLLYDVIWWFDLKFSSKPEVSQLSNAGGFHHTTGRTALQHRLMWSSNNPPLWHADLCDLQADHPKTGLPFRKDFSFSQVNWTHFNKRKWSPDAVSVILHLHLGRVEPFERLTKTSKQPGRWCAD